MFLKELLIKFERSKKKENVIPFLCIVLSFAFAKFERLQYYNRMSSV